MAAIMVQGTTSDAGKSAVCTALCRIYSDAGYRVAPFKPQNMALNSAVTVDGGEIGRAQALQAIAARTPCHTDMNPVLLKPNSDTGSQIIVHGHPIANMDARQYHAYKPQLLGAVVESFRRLQQQYDIIIVEGAGSPAEINLRQHDIANMGFAEAVDIPVILVADIERGGVFAQILGTLELLSATEKKRVVGTVINRFRGDVSLLTSGITTIANRTGVPSLGVIPYLPQLHLEAEDSLARHSAIAESSNSIRVVIPALPRMSNHTDFAPLAAHPQVELLYPAADTPIPVADLLILPGSKSVRSDLAWLRQQGWPDYIARHLRYGGKVLGICGGLQMLGREIADPHGIEGEIGNSTGLGLLEYSTTLQPQKQLRQTSGRLEILGDAVVNGYEIHAGITSGTALSRPFAQLQSGADGAVSEDRQIAATYLHGLFDTTAALTQLLSWAGLQQTEPLDFITLREQTINRLAESCRATLDWHQLGAYLPPLQEKLQG